MKALLFASFALGFGLPAHADPIVRCSSSNVNQLRSHLFLQDGEEVSSFVVSSCQSLAPTHSLCMPYRNEGQVQFDLRTGTYHSDLVEIVPTTNGYDFVDHRGGGLLLTFDQCEKD